MNENNTDAIVQVINSDFLLTMQRLELLALYLSNQQAPVGHEQTVIANQQAVKVKLAAMAKFWPPQAP